MRRYLLAAAALLALWSPAKAADSSVPTMTAGSAISDTDLMYCAQSAGTLDRKCTPLQLSTYIFGKVTGDLTCSGPTCTVTKSNGTAFGTAAFVNTGTSGATIGLLNAANAWSGVQSFNANDLLLAGVTGSTQCLHASSSGVVTGTGSDCGSGSGAVSSVTGGIGVTVSPTTGAAVVSTPVTFRNNTATTDTITSTDKGTTVTESNASAVAVAITTAGFVSTDYFTVKNKGAGLVTYTPSSGNIDGNGTLTLKQNQSADLYFDGTNYWTLPGRSTNVACADLTNASTLCSTAPGTGVATAAANALSAAGGLTSTILPNGTAVLGTSAIASGACATVVTTTATNVLTTDVVYYGYNSDPTGVTGYGASATGAVLSIYPYPTAGNLNVKVCNSTASSITPGAMTLNLNVHR